MQVDSDELVGLDIPLRSIFKPSWPATSHAPTVGSNGAIKNSPRMVMTMRISTILFCTLTTTLISCDCLVSHRGFVYDSRNEKPIDGATIVFANKEYKTDSLGYFEIEYMTGFCPDWKFEVRKKDYRSGYLEIEIDGDQRIYKVTRKVEGKEGTEEYSSSGFKIKQDTIYFYLTSLDDEI